MHLRHLKFLLVLPFAVALGGCELLGQEDPAKVAAVKEAEGKAIGGACRHSGRALEDCYVMNPKAQKSAIYAGWRDMDAYMRENNINAVTPDLVDAPSGGKDDKVAAPAKGGDEGNTKGSSDRKGTAKHSAAPHGGTAPLPRRFT